MSRNKHKQQPKTSAPPMRVIVREDQSGWAPPSPGHPSYRAWLYSGDEFGRSFKFNGNETMKVRETRSYAPAPTIVSGDDPPMRLAFESKLAILTDDEREVMRLQGKIPERKEQTITIAAGDIVQYQRNGYTLKPGSAFMVERPNLPPIECVTVVGHELIESKQMSYVDIAERMGIAAERVHSLVKSAMRKMRARH